MKTLTLLGLSVTVIAVFAGIWFLAQARLHTLPPDPTDFALRSRRETFIEVRDLAVGFIIAGGVVAAVSASLLGWRFCRRRQRRR